MAQTLWDVNRVKATTVRCARNPAQHVHRLNRLLKRVTNRHPQSAPHQILVTKLDHACSMRVSVRFQKASTSSPTAAVLSVLCVRLIDLICAPLIAGMLAVRAAYHMTSPTHDHTHTRTCTRSRHTYSHYIPSDLTWKRAYWTVDVCACRIPSR